MAARQKHNKKSEAIQNPTVRDLALPDRLNRPLRAERNAGTHPNRAITLGWRLSLCCWYWRAFNKLLISERNRPCRASEPILRFSAVGSSAERARWLRCRRRRRRYYITFRTRDVSFFISIQFQVFEHEHIHPEKETHTHTHINMHARPSILCVCVCVLFIQFKAICNFVCPRSGEKRKMRFDLNSRSCTIWCVCMCIWYNSIIYCTILLANW